MVSVNPMESIDLVQDKSQEKVLDWDATVKLNLLPLSFLTQNTVRICRLR